MTDQKSEKLEKELEIASKVIEAARYIGTEHSRICAAVACNCSGHAKRRVILANAIKDYDVAKEALENIGRQDL